MSRDYNDLFPKSENYLDFEIESQGREYYLPTANSFNESKIIEKEATAISRDGQSYFFADSKKCEVRSNDPNDLYRALDATFRKNPSISSKVLAAFNTVFGNTMTVVDRKAIDSHHEKAKNDGSSKPKM